MTKAHSELSDNGGRCESCNRPESQFEAQTTFRVFLGGGLGWGTMWLCDACYKEKTDKGMDGTKVPK